MMFPVDLTMNAYKQRKGEKVRNFLDSKLRGKKHPKPLTADTFLDVWKHYDTDGSRTLEKDEIQRFLRDFMTSTLGAGENQITAEEAQQLYTTFMEEFDEDKDGKISIQELALILPVEEGLFALLRHGASFGKGVDYMKVWKLFDKDLSGYIEAAELKDFLAAVLRRADPKTKITDAQLQSYAKTIMALYDVDGDGKLGLSELLKLLPATENFVEQAVEKARSLETLTEQEVLDVLRRYDKDGSETLEGTELSNLILDLLEMHAGKNNFDARQVYALQDTLLRGCDVDKDGRINKKELSIVLLAIVKHGIAGADKLDKARGPN